MTELILAQASPASAFYGAALLLEVGALIVAAVWAVGKIRSTTEALRHDIQQLGKTINDLKVALVRVEDRQWDQAQRLATLEASSHKGGS